MNPFYKQPTLTDQGECLNITPAKDGSLRIIEATKNAVIVQLMETWIDGELIPKRIVSIECVDETLLPYLKKEAHRILGEENR